MRTALKKGQIETRSVSMQNALSFALSIGVTDSWRQVVGPLITLTVSIEVDGKMHEWTKYRISGGPLLSKHGESLPAFTLAPIEWPAVHDGSDKPHGRKYLLPTKVEVSLEAMTDFEVGDFVLKAV